MCEQVSAVLRQWCSCWEGEVVHVCDGLDRVVESGPSLPAITQDLVVLHPGEGVLDEGADAPVFSVVFLLARSRGRPVRLRCGTSRPVLTQGTFAEKW
ncbi:hypothetical protein GCM10023334_087550 [Nonomuraea thailandensis]